MRPARSELHELFVEKFDRRYHPRKPITPEEVREIEVELGVVLPAVYGQLVGRSGCIDTSIDTLLEYEGPYHPQFEGFVRLEEILQVVGMGWITIVPAQLAGVSADVEGNVFDYLVPFGHD